MTRSDLGRTRLLVPIEQSGHFLRGGLQGRKAGIEIKERSCGASHPVVLEAQGTFASNSLANFGREVAAVGFDVRRL
jgi:hypothetical protein